MQKLCKICGIEKDIDEFRKTLCKKNNKFYYRNQCKKCENIITNERNKKYYLDNKEEINKKNRVRYFNKYKNDLDFKNKRTLYSKKYREKNKDIISLKRKERYKNNIEKEKEYKRQYCEKNREKIKEQSKIYYKNNKQKMLEYQKERRKTDKIYKFKKQVRTMLCHSFNRDGHVKQEKSEKILGCDFPFLYSYLLQTFKNKYGYEWDRIEPVHIDHIKPLATANTEQEITKLCHYTNLQLLKAEDNLKKSDKLDWNLGKEMSYDH